MALMDRTLRVPLAGCQVPSPFPLVYHIPYHPSIMDDLTESNLIASHAHARGMHVRVRLTLSHEV